MADIIHTPDQCPPGYNPFGEKYLIQFWQIISWFGQWLLAPLCWVITYLGLKEQEV
jgi:hypothetical protein